MAKCSQLEEQQAALRYVQRMQVRAPPSPPSPREGAVCSLCWQCNMVAKPSSNHRQLAIESENMTTGENTSVMAHPCGSLQMILDLTLAACVDKACVSRHRFTGLPLQEPNSLIVASNAECIKRALPCGIRVRITTMDEDVLPSQHWHARLFLTFLACRAGGAAEPDAELAWRPG